MSLHKYFKSHSADRMPTNVIPVAGTIAELTANEQNEVSGALKNMGARGSKRKKYEKYDDKKRSEVAKFALNSGVRSAERRYDIAESTIRGFIKSYKEAKAASKMDISSLPTKKRGKRTLLPEEIDKKVMDMASSMRLAGAVVNYNVLIAIAKGIVTANDRTLLAEYGGTLTLGWKWCTSLFKRMK